MGFFATRPFNSPLVFLAASANLFVGPTSCHQATKTAQGTIYFYWEALGSRGQRESAMMEDLEKTKPVAEPAMDDDETGAGCDVCMPPIALVGAEDYDYKYLCMPSMPWSKGGVEPPQFLAKDEKLPLTLSLIMGLQHALAMVAGIGDGGRSSRATPVRRQSPAVDARAGIATSGGMLIAGDACFAWQKDSEMCESREYLVSAAWITSGILTIIQVFRAKIIGTGYYLGTGLISVMGTSFTFLPIAREMVIRAITDAQAEGKCDCTPGTARRRLRDVRLPLRLQGLRQGGLRQVPRHGHGRGLPRGGHRAHAVKDAPEVVPARRDGRRGHAHRRVAHHRRHQVRRRRRVLRRERPRPLGGVRRAAALQRERQRHDSLWFSGARRPRVQRDFHERLPPVLREPLPQVDVPLLGPDVRLLRRRHQHVRGQGLGLGQLRANVFSFSKPDDKVIASQGPMKQGRQYKYFNNYRIRNAPWFTFLWAETFPLGFAPEYFLPILIGFFVSTAETIGDVTMSCKYSKLETEGPDFAESRVQGHREFNQRSQLHVHRADALGDNISSMAWDRPEI